jgi:sigma-B regulation protein RsbU (phosphoserine phosphatase)
LVFGLFALYTNLSYVLDVRSLSFPFLNELIFALFLFSFAYVAAQKVFASESRLLTIESELEVARQIQASILPTRLPEVTNLRIAVAYRPMTAVAGDFYEFLEVDQHRVGILVADVSGHGVPAALIASMIKVAAQSVVACAPDPTELLRGLNRILSGHLREQFVSAAYLWVDTEIAQARYSAAGHPPLLCWREGNLKRIESNGLLFGVPAESDYPVFDLALNPGDRLVLYTDGVIEPENAAGESFGDRRLEQVVRDNQSRPPLDFSNQLLSEVRDWQPASLTQQDDITLIVVDVV